MRRHWLFLSKTSPNHLTMGASVRCAARASRIGRGEFIALMGPSGCGKSTLLHIIAALDSPDEGRVIVAGQDLAKKRNLSRFRAHDVGLVFQMHNLLPALTAEENVQVPMFEAGLSGRERRKRARELLDLVGLGGRYGNRPTQLSGGERQRVAVARALANEPPILLADEPTGSLDSRAGAQILDLLEKLRDERQLTILMVTHDEHVAERADRIVRMLDGRVISSQLEKMSTSTESFEAHKSWSARELVRSQRRTSMIAFESVTKTYRTGPLEYPALSEVDLSIHPGEFAAVVGPSGSGKSTLLNLVACIDRPTSGTVRVGDVDVGKLDEDAAARWRGRNVGVVFQFFQLIPALTLVENVIMPMDFCGVHATGDRDGIARELLERFGVGEYADKFPSQVSGGQQQRAAIARALANDPPVLVADEPTGNLDSKNASAVMDHFVDLSERGRTILMVTHDRELAARAGRLVTVRDGRIVESPQLVR